MSLDSAKRVIYGNRGQIWVDNKLVAECHKFLAGPIIALDIIEDITPDCSNQED